MAFKEYHKGFSVEIQINGERDECGDKIYEYKIMSKRNADEVEEYCKKVFFKLLQGGNATSFCS